MRLWQSGLMDRVTYIASIVGLMVVGAMTASMIDITTPLSFTAGQTTMKVQDFIDKILPSLLPLLFTLGMYKLIRKGVNINWILLGTVAFGLLASAGPALTRGNTMQVEDYMNETPLRLLEMLTQTREDLWRAAQALTERGVTRIILTGSGTSYHGALTARAFMQRWCALPVDVCWPFMLDDETLARSGKALVVGISRGGGSLSTLAAMGRARNVGHITASMAGVAPATIDRAADYILTVPCGEETAGAKTKAITARFSI